MKENLKILKILLDKQALYYRSLSNEEIKALSEIQKELEKKYGKVKTKDYSIKDRIKQFIERIVKHNGENAQLLMVVEETCELNKEILKYVNRGFSNRKELVKELADVLLTSFEVGYIFDVSFSELEEIWEEKIAKVEKEVLKLG